jgi:RNA polymerase sigma factor (sigma-70 family)
MVQATFHKVLRDLHKLVSTGPVAGLSDAQLLKRFAAQRDGDAFAALVERHGPLVWGVCRRVLGHHQDCEDAFQATFLVLAGHAAAIRSGATLAGWLYRVAQRTALRARAGQARRQAHERKAAAVPEAKLQEELAWRELQRLLDAELSRLPEKFRAPFVLCCLEGKTKVEAAGQLGWKEGTVSGRLAQARRLLQERLARRGITLSAVLCAATLSLTTSAAPPALLRITALAGLLRAGGETATGVASASALTLADGVNKAMFLGKVKTATAILLALGLLALGAGLLKQRAAAAVEKRGSRIQERGTKVARSPIPPPPVSIPKKAPTKDGQTMAVSGQVLGPDGKAVAGARVAVVAMPRRWHRGKVGPVRQTVLGSTAADRQGRFHLTVPRTASATYTEVAALAGAPGYGAGWRWLKLNTARHQATLRLSPQQVIRGRLIDLQGQPAAGVKLRVVAVRDFHLPEPVRGLTVWPAPAATDHQGRFTVRGLGRNLAVTLLVQSDRFARQTIVIDTGTRGKPQKVRQVLAAARVIEGRVIAADTGKRLTNVFLEVSGGSDSWVGRGRGWADKRGRFRFISPPGNWVSIHAYPAEGEPYLCVAKFLSWPRGQVKQVVKVELPSGVVVRGRVTEKQSGKPVAGAVVEYRPEGNNPNLGHGITSWYVGGTEYVQTGRDGRFRAVVYPGPGRLLVLGPGGDYVHVKVGSFPYTGKEYGASIFPDALVRVNFKKWARPAEVAIRLRRGVTLKGRLVGPSGKPVKQALVLCYFHIPLGYFHYSQQPVPAKDGRFKLHGCDNRATFPVFFLDAKNRLGAVVQISGKELARQPVTVRLQRCGSAVMQLAYPRGKRRGAFVPGLTMKYGLGDWTIACSELDPVHHRRHVPDMHGRVTFRALIPGATYRYWDNGRARDFTVGAGKRVTLPDFTVR